MSDKWKHPRMAAHFDPHSSSAIEEIVAEEYGGGDAITVDGFLVGGSYGGDAYDEDFFERLPDAYYRQHASALPSDRAPGVDLAPVAEHEIDDGDDERDEDGRVVHVDSETCRCRRCTTVSAATLQRETRISGGGHGNGGKGRTKPVKVIRQTGSLHDDDAVVAGKAMTRVLVYGLTPAESEWYAARGHETSQAVLQLLVVLLDLDGRAPDRLALIASRAKQSGRARPNFAAWLRPEEARTLRAFPGSARAALVDYAHSQDHEAIAHHDAVLARGWEPVTAASAA